MEDLKIETDLLTKCRNSLEDFKNYAVDCDNVSEEEYGLVHNLAEKLNDRLIERQIELERLEECY